MSTCSYNGIIWNRHETLVCKSPAIKVCLIVVVATDEHNGFVRPLAIPLYNVVEVPSPFESNTIARNDDDRVSHLIMDTYFVYEQVEVAVDVSTDN